MRRFLIPKPIIGSSCFHQILWLKVFPSYDSCILFYTQHTEQQHPFNGWQKPQAGIVVMNDDGALNIRHSVSAVSVIARGSDGHCLGGSYANVGFFSPLVAEL